MVIHWYTSIIASYNHHRIKLFKVQPGGENHHKLHIPGDTYVGALTGKIPVLLASRFLHSGVFRSCSEMRGERLADTMLEIQVVIVRCHES